MSQTETMPARWWTAAACQDADTAAFFADGRGQLKAALTYCERCPVRVECLTDARERGETTGVWGGVIFHKVRG